MSSGVADSLERPHVLARAGDEGAVYVLVDAENMPHDVFRLVDPAQVQTHGVRGDEITPDVGGILDGCDGLCGNALLLLAHEVGVQIGLHLGAGVTART